MSKGRREVFFESKFPNCEVLEKFEQQLRCATPTQPREFWLACERDNLEVAPEIPIFDYLQDSYSGCAMLRAALHHGITSKMMSLTPHGGSDLCPHVRLRSNSTPRLSIRQSYTSDSYSVSLTDLMRGLVRKAQPMGYHQTGSSNSMLVCWSWRAPGMTINSCLVSVRLPLHGTWTGFVFSKARIFCLVSIKT